MAMNRRDLAAVWDMLRVIEEIQEDVRQGVLAEDVVGDRVMGLGEVRFDRVWF